MCSHLPLPRLALCTGLQASRHAPTPPHHSHSPHHHSHNHSPAQLPTTAN